MSELRDLTIMNLNGTKKDISLMTLAREQIKQQEKGRSLEICITPKPKTKILTNCPIICHIPQGGYIQKFIKN